MFCKHCGSQINEKARFCGDCGNPVMNQDGYTMGSMGFNQERETINAVTVLSTLLTMSGLIGLGGGQMLAMVGSIIVAIAAFIFWLQRKRTDQAIFLRRIWVSVISSCVAFLVYASTRHGIVYTGDFYFILITVFGAVGLVKYFLTKEPRRSRML